MKGGTDVGSRVRIAAAGLLVAASALLMGGIGDAVAYASPVRDSAGADGRDTGRTGYSRRDGPTTRPRAGRDREASTGAESRHGKPQGRMPGGRQLGERPRVRRPDHQKPHHDTQDDEKPSHDKPAAGRGAPTRPVSPAGSGSANEQEPEQDCGQQWPWSPPEPQPDTSPAPGSGGGGVSTPAQPVRRPKVPPMQLPAAPRPVTTPQVAATPITVPAVVAPPELVTGGGAQQALPPVPAAPADPPAATQPPPRTGVSAGIPATPFRVGYPDYLRGAGVAEVAALAGPGLAGILILSGVGALVGYRQAKAGHALRGQRAAKFVN